jgi:hypothetical protein
MALVFVDANVFLDSYRRVSKEYRDLLKSLLALGQTLYVTKTVVDEVGRSRVTAYQDANRLEVKSSGISGFEIAPHYGDDSGVVEVLNKRFRKLRSTVSQEIKQIAADMEAVHQRNLLAIVQGNDDVSILLESIFKSAEAETPAQLERARLRKERGNPPGKRTDPLGDQISWEQILERAVDADSVWIVSRDGDYSVMVGDIAYLQPPLQRELAAVRGVKTIKCHRYLATFFEEFAKAGVVAPSALPPQESVNAAKQQLPPDESIFEPVTWGLEEIVGGRRAWIEPIGVPVSDFSQYLNCPYHRSGRHKFTQSSIPRGDGRPGGKLVMVCDNCDLVIAYTLKTPELIRASSSAGYNES